MHSLPWPPAKCVTRLGEFLRSRQTGSPARGVRGIGSPANIKGHRARVALSREPMSHGHMTHAETIADRRKRLTCIPSRLQPRCELGASQHGNSGSSIPAHDVGEGFAAHGPPSLDSSIGARREGRGAPLLPERSISSRWRQVFKRDESLMDSHLRPGFETFHHRDPSFPSDQRDRRELDLLAASSLRLIAQLIPHPIASPSL